MAKPDVKALLMAKGEKIALIAAGVLMLLFIFFGILGMSDAFDPDKFVQDAERNEKAISNAINAPADPKVYGTLPTELQKPVKVGPVVSHWPSNLFFDPIAPPDKGRVNPVVLPVAEIQADFLWAKVLAVDVTEDANGTKLYGVVPATGKEKDKVDTERILREQGRRFNTSAGSEQPSSRFPGRQGDGKMPANAPPRAVPIEIGGARDEVQYVPFDPEKLKDKRLAWTILPRRMMVIQGSFPYKAQIEEFQRALRLENPIDVFDVYKPEIVPKFLGVLVQRQTLYPDGKVETPWTDIDVYTRYRTTIYPRKFRDKVEDPQTLYVMLQRERAPNLVMPLPVLLSGKYPDIRLGTISETIKRLVALNKPPEKQRVLTRFEEGGDIFAPVAANPTDTAGQPNIDGLSLPPGQMAGKEPDKEDPPTPETKFQELPDHILIRLIDDDIEPGRLYQYRMKVILQNPNWVGPKDKKGNPAYPDKVKEVSKPSDVQVMMIGGDVDDEPVLRERFGLRKDENPVKFPNKLTEEDLKKCLAPRTAWCELKAEQAVSVPREEFLFATDPPIDSRGKSEIPLKPGQGVLQVQRWLPIATIDGRYKEPVADWVVAEVVATRGTYLGGKQLVNLPIWSSKVNKYVLRFAEPEKGKTTPRRGVHMDPTQPGPKFIVADVEGGRVSNRPLTRTAFIDEDTAAEILLIDESTGGLQVRSAWEDRADAGRNFRERAWHAWIEQTEKDPQSLPDQPQKKNDTNTFN